MIGFFFISFSDEFCIYGNKRCRKNAFSKQVLKKVWNSKCCAVYICRRRISEIEGKYTVAYDAENAGEKNTASNRGGMPFGIGIFRRFFSNRHDPSSSSISM